MSIKRRTTNAEIARYMAARIEALNKVLVRNMCTIGEQVVNHARSLPSPNAAAFGGKAVPPHQPNYIDWSSNLRSSIGYAVTVDGNIVQMSSFEVVGNGDEGSKEGRDYVRKLAKNFPLGIVLIVVAGKEYASYVSAKGYDVIDSAELLARDLAPKMLKTLGF